MSNPEARKASGISHVAPKGSPFADKPPNGVNNRPESPLKGSVPVTGGPSGPFKGMNGASMAANSAVKPPLVNTNGPTRTANEDGPKGTPKGSNGVVKPPNNESTRTPNVDGPLGNQSTNGEHVPESGLATEHEDIIDDLEENAGMTLNLISIMHAMIEELETNLAKSEKNVADLAKSLGEKDAQFRQSQATAAEIKSKLTQRDAQLRSYKAAYERVKVVNENLGKTLTDRKSYFDNPQRAAATTDTRGTTRPIPLTWDNKRSPSLATSIASHDSRRGNSSDTIRTGGPSRSNSQQSANFEGTFQSIEEKPRAIEDLLAIIEGKNLNLQAENEALKAGIQDKLEGIESELRRQGEVQKDILRNIRDLKGEAIQGNRNVRQEIGNLRAGIQSIERSQGNGGAEPGEIRKIQEDVKHIKRKVDAEPRSSSCCCIC
ncbi:hypothetical protein BDW59DRAFT_161002 [Aspergillus cavernicola]|uniref:t-SNARE coiled-coil homology domain-containing protein n=1 Tax=Aspergillus cavernicola TaxID=176166 RepID=A0ABR4IGW1_9EURO